MMKMMKLVLMMMTIMMMVMKRFAGQVVGLCGYLGGNWMW